MLGDDALRGVNKTTQKMFYDSKDNPESYLKNLEQKMRNIFKDPIFKISLNSVKEMATQYSYLMVEYRWPIEYKNLEIYVIKNVIGKIEAYIDNGLICLRLI